MTCKRNSPSARARLEAESQLTLSSDFLFSPIILRLLIQGSFYIFLEVCCCVLWQQFGLSFWRSPSNLLLFIHGKQVIKRVCLSCHCTRHTASALFFKCCLSMAAGSADSSFAAFGTCRIYTAQLTQRVSKQITIL